MVKRLTTICLIGMLLAGCGGSSWQPPGVEQPNSESPIETPYQGNEPGLTVLRDTSGAPVGIRVTWTRVTTAGVQGYYIYRDTESFSDGDPEGNESQRVDAGGVSGMYDQPDSGDSISFNDDFAPSFEDTYYYRITVMNSTSDESDFSNQMSIEISQHTVTGVSQDGGSIGDEVTIAGTWFGDTQESDKVFFSAADGDIDIEATTYVSWSATEIVVQVPYGAADGQVGVEVSGTQVDSASDQTFDYNEPSFDSISPTSDWVQNQYITLTGEDFGPAPDSGGDDTTVSFGGVNAQEADINLATWTDTNIEVKVPSSADGGLLDVVIIVAGNESNTQSFTVLPHIDSLDVSSGNTGDTVTISGTTFGGTQGSGEVKVNGVDASISSWSNTSIEITIPVDAVDGDVVVTDDNDSESNGVGFDVIPTLNGFTPIRTYHGQTVTVTGTGFGADRNTSLITFDGSGGSPVDAETYNAWDNDEIELVVPAGAETGTLTITIADNPVGSDNDEASTSSSIVITLAPPLLTDIGQL